MPRRSKTWVKSATVVVVAANLVVALVVAVAAAEDALAEELELEPEKARALLRSPCPLSDVYKEFRDRETEHMDTIRDSIETEADKSLQRQEKKQQRESR